MQHLDKKKFYEQDYAETLTSGNSWCCGNALQLVWSIYCCLTWCACPGSVDASSVHVMTAHFCVCTGIDACKRWPQGLVLKDEQMCVSKEGSFRMHWTEHMELDKEE